MLSNNEGKRSKRIERNKKIIINEFCYILCMIINNNFLQCIFLFFTEKFCLKFNNILKICLRCVMKPKQINKYNIFVTFSQFEFRFK